MTQVQPDWAQFRRHVVRIDGRGRTLLGTGFFVAPRLVLTAAHVVYDARRREPLEQVEVVPADPGVGTGAVRARVIARSAPASGTLLPPFPDLAVLELPPELSWVDSHPCVWLSDGLPVGEWCYAYGFAPREPGVVPGAPASLRFEGPDGDGFLRFKSVQVAGGLSGAPLVCPGQRAVVGVVTASRDVSSDLGGWASPIAALFGGAAELAEAGARIRAANRPAVLADRGAWHAVLPLRPAADPVKRDNHFVREPRSLPSEMLLADANTVAYRFRERQLDRARRWCERPEPLAISLVWGPAGAGKTRLAIELCRLMRSRHWLAQLWVPPSPGGRARPDISRLPLPRLLVVDYAESVAPASLLRLLEDLHIRATELIPARVVLLTRDAGEGDKLLREIAGQAEVDLRNVINATGAAVTIPGLTPDERGILFTEAYQSFRSAWREDPAGGPVREPDLSGDRYAVVLEVLLEAFDHALSGGRPTGDRPPVDRSLDHEQRYWTATAPKKLSAELRRAAVALATMAGGADAEESAALL
ncbi:MAG TPA: serine protease, partial [Rugosimonospora sp.]|nr:serine protease [Rugosimonospora sp.]